MTAIQQKIQTAFAALFLFLAGLMLLTLASCEERKTVIIDKPDTVGEKIEDRVNDALDRRPNEKVRDVVEDTEDAVEDVADSVRDAAEN